MRTSNRAVALPLALGLGLITASPVIAQTVAPAYAGAYTAVSLGTPLGVPGALGGLTFLDANTMLVGGAANGPGGGIYKVGLLRDISSHVIGFSGSASLYSTAPYIDGGLSFGPGGVLFYTGYPTNTLGQIKPGSTSPDKVLSLPGISPSVGSLAFVPAGHPGAGQMKFASYNANTFYSAVLTADGLGTYNVSTVFEAALSGGVEGIAYVPTGSPIFLTNDFMLISEYGTGKVAAYKVDANGDPIAGSRTDFITGLGGAEGAVIDPVTGDFLFSTFGGGDRIVAVHGFVAPPDPSVAPEPATFALLASGMAGLFGVARVRRRAR